MKIIRRGDDTPWWSGKQAICVRCRTVVEFEAADELDEQYRAVWGIRQYYVSVPCPVCDEAAIELTYAEAMEQTDAARTETV